MQNRWAYKRGGAYIRKNVFVSKWIGLYPRGFNLGFYGIYRLSLQQQ